MTSTKCILLDIICCCVVVCRCQCRQKSPGWSVVWITWWSCASPSPDSNTPPPQHGPVQNLDQHHTSASSMDWSKATTRWTNALASLWIGSKAPCFARLNLDWTKITCTTPLPQVWNGPKLPHFSGLSLDWSKTNMLWTKFGPVEKHPTWPTNLAPSIWTPVQNHYNDNNTGKS
jgi:hypothetical protein